MYVVKDVCVFTLQSVYIYIYSFVYVHVCIMYRMMNVMISLYIVPLVVKL